MSASSHPPEEVEGEILPAKSGRISWAWLFPLLALTATIWLFWNNWRTQGPEITIQFAEAPGIQPGKTALIYRGVQAGNVTDVRLDTDLDMVVVKVRLKAFASELAREGTDFWVEQPIISLREIAGLESIIQGNTIHARIGHAGASRTDFIGLATAPLSPMDAPALVLSLKADSIPFLGRGTPVYHRGVRVGWVRDKILDEAGRATAQVVVEQVYADRVKSNSRFWALPATEVAAGPGQLSLSIPAIEALLYGGIEFAEFSPGGSKVAGGAEFELFPNMASARAEGAPLEITFPEAEGLREGQTRVCYLGQPIGLLDQVVVDPVSGEAVTRVRLEAPFASMATASSVFTVVRPSISAQGITGLETIVTGPYIDFSPGAGDIPATRFTGRVLRQIDWNLADEQPGSVRFTLRAGSTPSLEPGAPVYHGGIVAGRVVEKRLDPKGQAELVISVPAGNAGAVKANARFWYVPAASVAAGPGVLDVRFEGIAALWQGGIGFDIFGSPAETALPGSTFDLHASRRLAAAVSPPVRIEVFNAQGILPGQTELRYLGVPAGVVTDVKSSKDKIEAVVRFFEGFDFLRRKGSQFAIVRPEISLQGVHGLEALVSGVYFICVAGSGDGYAGNFTVTTTTTPELLEDTGFEIYLLSEATPIDVGAQVLYNETPVGEITQKNLSPDGRQIRLTARINESHRNLVRKNSVFWNASSVEARVGFLKIQIKAPSVVAPSGRVSFYTPGTGGTAVKEGSEFDLQDKRPRRF